MFLLYKNQLAPPDGGVLLLPLVAKVEASTKYIRSAEEPITIKMCSMDHVKENVNNEKPSKGGRPPKTVKRSEILMVRVTVPERLNIENKARKAGISLSEWVRSAAKSAKVIPRLSSEEMRCLRSLSGLANNLNQLTRLAHASGLISISQACRKLLEQTNQLMQKLMNDDR